MYKCEQEGGKVEYQSLPCEKGRETSIIQAGSTVLSTKTSVPLSGSKRKCAGKELRISFSNMSVRATLQVLAEFSGNKLVVDSSVSGSGAFNYDCVPWDTVLQDIASTHDLAVKVENGTIFAKRR